MAKNFRESIEDTLDPIVTEAQKRFKKCEDWESKARTNFNADLKFAEADSENGYQWPNDLRKQRDLDERPCLTINKTRQHNLQIINDAKQNKPGIAVKASGGGASYEAAQIMSGVIRHIECQSNATVAYDMATEFQVKAGWGYWRVVTEYASERTFDQEIFIRAVPDPMMVYLDPNIKERNGSDAKFGFVFTDMDRSDFEEQWPEWKDRVPAGTLNQVAASWMSEEKVRLCEYFRKVEIEDRLASFVDEQGMRQTVLESEIGKDFFKEVLALPDVRTRNVLTPKIEWYLIIGTEVAEKTDWPGKYIPIVRVVGEEVIIDGLLDRKGHTRAMKDPQRMYNYWTSSAVEHVALQGKTPWVAPSEAIEGYEGYWESANRVNHAVLPYNGTNDQGQPMAPPQRAQPPQMAQAYLQGMQVASMEFMMASGQYENQMGERGNERSGVAIDKRQRKGDIATYHFTDNLSVAVQYTGMILLDLIPKIYDTKRMLQIIGEDGTNIALTIDPQAQAVLTQRMNQDGQIIERVFNPGLGEYFVQADVGPGYATKREAAFDAFVTLITQSPQLTGVIGDIMLKAADFPMADEAAERLKRTIPPQVLGNGPTQQEQQLQAQLMQMQQLLDASADELAKAKLQLKGKDQLRDIDAYEAETKRMVALKDAVDPEALRPIIATLVAEALKTSSLSHIFGANQQGSEEAELRQAQAAQGQAPALAQAATIPQGLPEGTRRGSDGGLYAPHPQIQGKWLQLGEAQ